MNVWEGGATLVSSPFRVLFRTYLGCTCTCMLLRGRGREEWTGGRGVSDSNSDSRSRRFSDRDPDPDSDSDSNSDSQIPNPRLSVPPHRETPQKVKKKEFKKGIPYQPRTHTNTEHEEAYDASRPSNLEAIEASGSEDSQDPRSKIQDSYSKIHIPRSNIKY